MKNFEAVIFDLDNTLFDEVEYFLAIFSKFDDTKNKLGYIKKLFDEGLRYKSKDIFKDVLNLLKVYSKRLHDDLFFEYKNCVPNIKLDKDTIKTLAFLRSKEIKIGILTNGVIEAQKNKVKLLGLESLVDVIVYARAAGKEKPHIDSFRLVCNKLKTSSKRSIFIGDSVVNDILGAENAGLKAILIQKYAPNSKKSNEKNILFNQVSELIL